MRAGEGKKAFPRPCFRVCKFADYLKPANLRVVVRKLDQLGPSSVPHRLSRRPKGLFDLLSRLHQEYKCSRLPALPEPAVQEEHSERGR
jgi:hypothetical protein